MTLCKLYKILNRNCIRLLPISKKGELPLGIYKNIFLKILYKFEPPREFKANHLELKIKILWKI